MKSEMTQKVGRGGNFFINRELSWLDFNSRVLAEAFCKNNPLLERLKFIAIFSSNLDEFFMVRVAGLRQLAKLDSVAADQCGLTAGMQLKKIREKCLALLKLQARCFNRKLLPQLAENKIFLVKYNQLNFSAQNELKQYFSSQVAPILTPLALDPSHPFPVLGNGAIEIAVMLKNPDKPETLYAFVEVPEQLPRFVEVSEMRGGSYFVALEEIIIANLTDIFAGCDIIEALPFRITRDMDFTILEEGVSDLLRSIEHTLLERRSREPIRLEFPCGAKGPLYQWLMEQFKLDEDLRYALGVPLNLKQLFELIGKINRPELLEAPWMPLSNMAFEGYNDIFEAIRTQGNILHMVPFFSFDPIVKLLNSAADDPDVLAIKQTLYRVSGNSSVIQALQRAAERGKQVTVIVELKARFDEGNNIAWARKLEESGAHVVYGISGLKIHGKALLIVRREAGLIRRYVHLSTGNYNDKTAKIYTDSSIFSYDQQLCAEIAALFNIMTGYAAARQEWSKIAVAPFDLRRRLLALIDREREHAEAGGRGKIIAKMNSLTDPEIIVHLYDAAQAGVKIDLIVRGICCLKSGKNIRVCSIVDRYLEHSRIFYFHNNGNKKYFLSSADWMMRNLDRRIEIMFPLENPFHCKIIAQILAMQLEDREKGRFQRSDGHYRSAGAKRYNGRRSQYRSYQLWEEFNRSKQHQKRDFVIFKSPHEAQKATNQEY